MLVSLSGIQLSIENSGEIIFEVKIPLYYTLTRDLRECLSLFAAATLFKLSTSKYSVL
jgi:hypothetical protein